MGIELVPATSEHVSELGRILYEAFKDIFDRHHVSAGFPSVSVTRKSIGNYVERDDYFGLTAIVDGDIGGSAFMLVSDEVGGVGPITVEVPLQGRSIGRMLMEGLIDYGHQNGMEQMRLLQDAVNVASVSLYTSLGFDARESVAFMQAAPRNDSEGLVRPMTEADLPAIDEISRRIYKVSRRNEVAVVLQESRPALLRERDGRLMGYFIPGAGGHGVAETDDDMVALIGESAERFPPEVARFFCPLGEAALYRKLLKAGKSARESVAFMQAAPRNDSEGLVRPMTEADLPAIDEISRRIYKVSRRNEVAVVLQESRPALLRERDGRLMGYFIPGAGGHGVAETDDDMVALIGESAERFPPEVARFFCPLGEAALYRKLLKAGCRATRLLNLMSMGPYDAPDEVWLPSILY